MRPICVAFSKVKVLVIGQDDVVKDRLKGVLTGFGVLDAKIFDCTSWKTRPETPLHEYDLIVLDCATDRFSRDLAIEELSGGEDSELPLAPVVLIADGDAEASIEQAFGEKEHMIIKPSFCAKSLYLKLHLMISKFSSSLVNENVMTVDELLSGRDYQIPAI